MIQLKYTRPEQSQNKRSAPNVFSSDRCMFTVGLGHQIQPVFQLSAHATTWKAHWLHFDWPDILLNICRSYICGTMNISGPANVNRTHGHCLHRFVVSFFSLAWPHHDLLKMWFESNDVRMQTIPVIIIDMNEKARGVFINLDISGHSRRVWSLSCAFPVKDDCWVFGPVLLRVWRWCYSCWARGGSG